MNFKVFIIGIILLAASILTLTYGKDILPENINRKEKPLPKLPTHINIQFSNITYRVYGKFILKNNEKIPLKDFVYVTIPRNTTYQSTKVIYIKPKPSRIQIDEDGNVFAVVEISADPGEKKQINVEFLVKVSGYKIIYNPSESYWPDIDMVRELTTKTNFWNTENSTLISLAYKVGKGDTPLEISKNIAKWMVKHVNYHVYFGRSGSDHSIVRMGLDYYVTGDCVEVADTFVTLARIRGIPARTVFGIYLTEHTTKQWLNYSTLREEGENILDHWGGHMWSQVYLPPWGWVDVELLEYMKPKVGDFTNYHIVYGIEETKYYGTLLTSTCLPSYLDLEYVELEFKPEG
ncbi:MAG: transglutaminase domain-containing protein [Thermoproteales archaeon]|nr:transglutaminase domain-containing protein [Thermoproteales archaeon]